MAETSPREHRDEDAARHHERRETERYLVAHPSGGVLVDLGPWDVFEARYGARVEHRVHEVPGFGIGHPREEHRHEHRAHLVIGELSAHVEVDGREELFARELASISLL